MDVRRKTEHMAVERLAETQPHFEGMSRREILESQDPATLVALKAQMLEQLSDLERDIHLVNDVIDGYGVIGFPTAYAGENPNIVLGEE